MGEPDLEKPEEKEAREKAYWENQKKICDGLTPIDANLKKIKEYIEEKQNEDPMYDAEPPAQRPLSHPRLAPCPSPLRGRGPNNKYSPPRPSPFAAPQAEKRHRHDL